MNGTPRSAPEVDLVWPVEQWHRQPTNKLSRTIELWVVDFLVTPPDVFRTLHPSRGLGDDFRRSPESARSARRNYCGGDTFLEAGLTPGYDFGTVGGG